LPLIAIASFRHLDYAAPNAALTRRRGVMAYSAAADLVAELRSFRILEPAQLDEAARLADTEADPKALARLLVERRRLTPYQANLLLLGRGAELVLGSYIILARVGEGGMGEVFRARHRRLGHIVALKLIRKDRLSNPAAVQRFEREIAVACQVAHPNVVRAFDADVAGGKMFLAMEFVEGLDLDTLLSGNGPLPIAEACEYARQTAAGLAACHERGLVHRDIKPKNLLLTRAGIENPKSEIRNPKSAFPTLDSRLPLIKILDLGLARFDDAGPEQTAPRLTQLGKVVGTADYMAPEQGRDSHNVDGRADLYSLGCLLFFLLTGKPPFSGGTKIEKIVSHQLEEAPRLERVRPDVPTELAAVVRKLLAKHPDDRYQSAAEVFAALEPFIPVPEPEREPEPTEEFALPSPGSIIVPPRPRSASHGHRRRVALIGAAGGGVLCAGFVVAILAQERTGPEDRPNRSAEVPVSPVLNIPAAPVAQFDPPAVPQERKPLHGPPELVAVAGESRQRHWAPVGCVAVSLDERLIAGGGLDNAVRVWDARTGEQRASFRLSGNGVSAVTFCSDGRLIAVAIAAGKPPDVREWDSSNGQILARDLPGIEGADAVDVSPDGRTLAVRYWKRAASGMVGGVQLWNLALNELGRDLPSKTPITAWAWSRDGMTLATAAGKLIAVWDVSSGREQSSWAAHDAVTTCLAVSRDGAQVASASTQWSRGKGGEVRVWDALGGKQLAVLHTAEPPASLAFGPEDLLAVGTGQAQVGHIEIHDWAKGESLSVLKGHGGPVMALAFGGDGRTLASGGSDHTVRIWDVDAGKERNPLSRQHGPASRVVFAPDSRSLAVLIGPWEPHVRLLDLAAGQERDLPTDHRGGITAVGFTAGGKAAAWGPWGATVWDAANGQVTAQLNAPGDTKLWGELAPDGRTVAAANTKAPTIALWDIVAPAASGPKLTLPGHKGTLTALTFAPDGKTLATAGTDRTVILWNIAQSGRETPLLRFSLSGHRDSVVALAFSADSRLLASASPDGAVLLHETAGGVERATLSAPAGVVGSLLFSPDGKTLAGWSHHGLRLWDVADRKEIPVPKSSGVLRAVAFAPDSRKLACACHDGQVSIWQIGSAEATAERRLEGPVHHVAFSPDGRYLATANGNGTAYVLRIGPAQGTIARASP
jgi:serine/threonine-protein kinase